MDLSHCIIKWGCIFTLNALVCSVTMLVLLRMCSIACSFCRSYFLKDHTMQIAKNSVVTLNYTMFDEQGTIIDKNQQPIVYLHGGYDNILPAVEAALDGQNPGQLISVTMQPDEAFGEFDPSLVHEEDVGLFPPDLEVGMMFETRDPETEESAQFRVTAIDAGMVTVDGNHPLAGMVVRFDAEILDVRAASEEEIAHGHVHGEHGHDH
jgi:FKBP-type peptidyl-prolyl cis-trans isomerase SlyD